MADLRISELPALAGANLASGDLLAIADVSASETKKITVVDLVGNATTLIADATIPSAKILFGSGTISGSSIANGGVDTAQLADNAVTAAKLADESTVDLVTTLPASGAFVGQIALDTDDSKGYIWNGSAWVSFKAAGSVNTVVGDTAGIVNLSVATSGDQVTITTSLDNTAAAAQFLAGPTAAAGAVSYRQIASGDLPTASSGGKGAVQVSGNGLTMSGDLIAIDNTVTAQTVNYNVVKYSANGLVTDGRSITAADLPAATSGAKGAVYPGTGLAVDGSGQLSHTNAVTAGTATKVTFDAQGHITATQLLAADDIPNIDASKITTGTLASARLGAQTVTAAKIANEATVLFGGSGSTAGIVTFPAAQFKGQYFYDELNQDLYIWSGSAWLPVTIISGELVYAGTYDASVNQVASVTSAGAAVGLTAGSALPAASSTNNRYYVVVSDSGTGTGNAPAEALAPPDMILSNGASWDLIDVSSGIGSQLASNVTFTPYGTISATNVQAAIEDLDDSKLAKAGGTVTGELLIGTAGSFVFEGSTADDFETTLAVTDPTADRTITLPDQDGTVLVSGNASIVNADISASAEIAVSKLANGTARQLLQTDAAGTDVEWASNIDIPGTLDVTSTATFDSTVAIGDGNLNYSDGTY